MRRPPKRKTPGGGMPGAMGCSRRYPDTPNSVNPQGPRLHIRVLKREDGHAVALFGAVGGYLTTIARGLTEGEANERAETEAAERGIEVRNG